MARLRNLEKSFAAAVLALALVTPSAEAQVARLVGWARPARLAPLNGPGEPMFVLPAMIRWKAGLLRDERDYQIQVRLPDGTIRVNPLTPAQRPGATTLTALVPASAVRNLHPEQVRVTVTLLDAATGANASNALDATISEFPAPASETVGDSGPFGFGQPLGPAGPAARPLRTPEPDRLAFLPLPDGSPTSTTYLATQEISNRQAAAHLDAYDPKGGRSDEFTLEGAAQPALGLTRTSAQSYLTRLSISLGAGVTFRFPTESEWLSAARAGSSAPFWWGDSPTYAAGANLLGPEPGRNEDVTGPVEGDLSVEPNPWGFLNTFGNVAEWATSDSSTALRMGGHFRTEPDGRLDPIEVTEPDRTGPDPFVGLRPALTLESEPIARSIESLLHRERGLAEASVTFDASRAVATLTGPVPDSAARRRADEILRTLWYVAAVENRLAPPSVDPGRLARLVGIAGPAERRRILDRFEVVVPLNVLWDLELPVVGSDWWVNVQTPVGEWTSYRLPEKLVGQPVVPVVVPAGPYGPVDGLVGLSIGTPDPGLLGPLAASQVLPIRADVP